MSEPAAQQPWPSRFSAARTLSPEGRPLRLVALGDSATCGVGDPAPDGSWRGWARLLAASIAEAHDLSFYNLAVSGSTSAEVRRSQLPAAFEHHPDLASLVVGLTTSCGLPGTPATCEQICSAPHEHLLNREPCC
jgi:lysophospholipase L1-like esterase